MINNKLIISPSPHIHSNDSIEKNMYGVIIALLPVLLVSFYYFGLGAIAITLVSVFSCMAAEYLIQRFMLKGGNTLPDGSAALTGLLLSLNLPSNLPLWIVVIGAIVAIGIGKMPFGGLGNNIFNPALVGRVFMLISFPAQMTSWPLAGSPGNYPDGLTGATPLSLLKYGHGNDIDTLSLLLGNTGGSLGETCSIALLLGLAFLLWRKIITWHIPVSILFSAGVFAFLIGEDPVLHLLSGGMLLGAVFMATDYVTSPMNKRGMLIYGVCIGILTIIIRKWSDYPEGMSFAILIMNAFTPLINTYVKPKHFGEVVKNG
mgnify:CR=1 FL=1